MFENINASVFRKEISRNPHAQILDVRTADEYDLGHIPHAINIDFRSPEFARNIQSLDKTQHYLVYCRSGSRSFNACTLMQSMGFHQLANMQGGIISWEGKLNKNL